VVDRLRKRLDRLGAPEAFSLRIALITFPFAVAFAIGLDRPRLGGSLVAWLGIVLVAQLAVVLVALPLRLTILRAGERAARPLTTLLAFGLLGSLRGLTLNVVALEVGIADHIEWTSRIVGGFLAGAVIGGVTAYFTVASIEHRATLRLLLEQQASLTAARERETTLLAQVRRELGQLVDEQVIRPLRMLADELRAATPGASLGAADRVDQLVEEHTRPVSALLLSLPDDTMITPGTIAADQATTTTWRRLRDSSALAARSRPLQPLIPALAIGIWGFGSIALGSTSARALIGAVAAVAVTVVLTALLDRQWHRVARLSDLICVLLAIAAISSAILAGIGTYVAVTGSLDPWKGITVLFLVVVATAAARLRTLAAALQTEREALEHNLRSTVDELEWQVAHVRARVRAKREALARVVHGPVQAHGSPLPSATARSTMRCCAPSPPNSMPRSPPSPSRAPRASKSPRCSGNSFASGTAWSRSSWPSPPQPRMPSPPTQMPPRPSWRSRARRSSTPCATQAARRSPSTSRSTAPTSRAWSPSAT
jgi:hypothetical protein